MERTKISEPCESSKGNSLSLLLLAPRPLMVYFQSTAVGVLEKSSNCALTSRPGHGPAWAPSPRPLPRAGQSVGASTQMCIEQRKDMQSAFPVADALGQFSAAPRTGAPPPAVWCGLPERAAGRDAVVPTSVLWAQSQTPQTGKSRQLRPAGSHVLTPSATSLRRGLGSLQKNTFVFSIKRKSQLSWRSHKFLQLL